VPKCALHPGRDSVTIVFGKNYCEKCRDGIAAARHRVDRHVEPKDCFIWYVSNDNWQPITGTGCAHWVSHQMNIHAGTGSDCCFSGFPTAAVNDLCGGHAGTHPRVMASVSS
jgi:hypothetical protein